MVYNMNPTVNDFAPNCTQQNDIARQVSFPSSSYHEARILNLEEGHASLREDIGLLREMYHDLSSSVKILEKGGRPVHVGPFQVDVEKSHRDAVELNLELEKLKHEVAQSVESSADAQKANAAVTPKENNMATSKTTDSVPPHLRAFGAASSGTVKKSLPPHLRNKKVVTSDDNR